MPTTTEHLQTGAPGWTAHVAWAGSRVVLSSEVTGITCALPPGMVSSGTASPTGWAFAVRDDGFQFGGLLKVVWLWGGL